MSKMTPKQMLEIEFHCDDLDGVVTIRDYLATLLETLWEEQEGFSGKRPFGNSGWEFDLQNALVLGGAIAGTVDEEEGDVFVEDVDAAHDAIRSCISEVFYQSEKK